MKIYLVNRNELNPAIIASKLPDKMKILAGGYDDKYAFIVGNALGLKFIEDSELNAFQAPKNAIVVDKFDGDCHTGVVQFSCGTYCARHHASSHLDKRSKIDIVERGATDQEWATYHQRFEMPMTLQEFIHAYPSLTRSEHFYPLA